LDREQLAPEMLVRIGISSEFLTLALSSAAIQTDLSSFKTGLAEPKTNISQAIVKRQSVPAPKESERTRICERIQASAESGQVV
jgi:hypothetical protein